MDSITTQEDFAYFLKNHRNSKELNDLVEDIRYTLMDYQVCTPKRTHSHCILTFVSDFITTRHLQQELSADCKFHSAVVQCCVVTCE